MTNPHFARIHSSLAHVLYVHKSGTEGIMDAAVAGQNNWFENDDGVLCGGDWQLLMLKEELRGSDIYEHHFRGGSPWTAT